MTSEGEEQFPFHQHVRSERAGEVFKPQDSSRSLRNLPTKLQLPTELQWRVMDFCADRATLWQLMHTSSGLRAEASKRFWADPHTYYHIEAPWLIDGGWPGNTGSDMTFLTHVENIEIEYGIEADALFRPRGENGPGDIEYDLVSSFWRTLKQRCPSVRRVVFNQTWHTRLQARRDVMSGGDLEGPLWLSACLKVLAPLTPPDVEVFAFVLTSAIYNANDPHGANGQLAPPRSDRTLYQYKTQKLSEEYEQRLSQQGTVRSPTRRSRSRWEESGQPLNYRAVLVPFKHFRGPVGTFEHLRYANERICSQRLGLGAVMIAALARHHSNDNKETPFACPMPYCTPPGFGCAQDWIVHAARTHANDLLSPRYQYRFDRWPSEIRPVYMQRKIEIFMKSQKIDLELKRLRRVWDEGDGQNRKDIEAAWMEQLESDEDWETGKLARESLLWTRFASRMRMWKRED
jgi:hypothetical protein